MDNSCRSTLTSLSFRPLPLIVAMSLAINGVLPAAAFEQPYRVADDAMPASPAPGPQATPPAAQTSGAPPAFSDRAVQENMFWESAQRSNTAADYKAYLDAFPNGIYAPLAKNRITAIGVAPVAATTAALSPPPPPGFPSAFGPPPATVTPEALKAEVGTVETEQALNMGPPQRMELQQRLAALSLYNGPIDGDFGPGVRSAIAEWQKRHSVAPTGEIGQLELAVLRVESEANFQQMAVEPPTPIGPRPTYLAPRPVHVYHSAPSYAAPAALGILGGLALGILGSKLGGKGGEKVTTSAINAFFQIFPPRQTQGAQLRHRGLGAHSQGKSAPAASARLAWPPATKLASDGARAFARAIPAHLTQPIFQRQRRPHGRVVGRRHRIVARAASTSRDITPASFQGRPRGAATI